MDADVKRQALLVLTVVAGSCSAVAQAARTTELSLETQSYIVRVEEHCREGSVTCGKVRFDVTNRQSKRTFSTWGRTVPAQCTDERGCSRLGYEFDRNGLSYYITRPRLRRSEFLGRRSLPR